MIDATEPRQTLQTAIDNKLTAIMSYLSKGKWHVAKVMPTAVDGNRLSVQTTHSQRRHHPININIGQPVGISFKHDYGKYVFDATVVGLEPATSPDGGGTLVLTVPERIEVIQRRSYFRVEVPESMKVKVILWHRKSRQEAPDSMAGPAGEPGRYRGGTLIDISAGGAQVMLDGDESTEPQFRKGQFIGMRFTPLPYETPLVIDAQIRNALPRSDRKSIYLGLQLVGLEASSEGREVLTRLVGIVEQYYKMNQSGKKPSAQTAHAEAAAP